MVIDNIGGYQTKTMGNLDRNLDFVKINVGGKNYLTRRKHFASYPKSRLSKIVRARDARTILELCDAFSPGRRGRSAGQHQHNHHHHHQHHHSRDDMEEEDFIDADSSHLLGEIKHHSNCLCRA